MSLLGKILLFVNLLAAAGFGYLALQDWKGRQTITAHGQRHIILLAGVPLGGGKDDPPDTLPTDPEAEIRFPVEGPGGVYTETVSPAMLKAYFAPAGGGSPVEGGVTLAANTPVATQLAELKRVYALIKGAVERADGQRALANVVANWLILQPETYDERLEIQTRLQAEDGNWLRDRLYAKFDQVLTPGGETGVKDETERRARLAHLLVHLDRDPAWQKRVMMVVGLRRYVRTVAEQAVRFRMMAARVERLTLDDQSRFAEEYARLKGLAIERTQMVRDMAEVKARLDEQKRKDEEFVAQRRTQLAGLTTQLQRIKAEVDALLAEQTAVEAQLFAVQREVALTLEDIYRLQAELVKQEDERYKQSGPPKK
jgi:hypothetical protein